LKETVKEKGRAMRKGSVKFCRRIQRKQNAKSVRMQVGFA
jgi:hypothetical protein